MRNLTIIFWVNCLMTKAAKMLRILSEYKYLLISSRWYSIDGLIEMLERKKL